ncbi:short-chain dehydrogenase, putative [Penicillium digitatum]|uniref:Hydroxyneurosporene synthase (CrtC) n=3 Tax=Penicillium digitatum TaxID=36651 RepID=K9FVR8_PEND2|nr:hypothetical protein PDIP_40960 [Penicillium digitatum Pd1]EKV12637.1 hypothetical protein PDIG_42380 [Penicillium digitatum PHI26]EKV15215.1 hypothetical protein PDIP_40960 [Penicillium digitatum Pd1]KAG0152850.1 hypothetical protein PDIDSM_2655 [Penicillium digitatum]QQK46523.1 short-chain dehydrogenase, putative [Penicillium digitatum]
MYLSASCLSLLFCFYATARSAEVSASELLNTTTPSALPVFYDASDIDLVEANHATDSYWVANYIRTTSNESFYVSAHIMVRNGSATQRAGIMSLDKPLGYYKQNYQNIGPVRESNGTLEPFNITMPGGKFGMEAIPHKNAARETFLPMRIHSHLPEVTFDIDLDMKGPVVLNAGLGSWLWAGGLQNQISLPVTRPRGSLVVDNRKLTIDSKKSFSWYDRQWGPTSPERFTWLGLYLNAPNKTESYLSIWNWEDSVNGNKSFATLQSRAGTNTVLSLTRFEASDKHVLNSTVTGNKYSLEYKIKLADGTQLRVKSARPNQEFVMENSTVGFYSGYVEVSGDYTGYGAMDIMPPIKL